MSKALAIRSITTSPDGRVEVAYSIGTSAGNVPPAPDGGFTWQSLGELQSEIKTLEQTLSNYQLTLLHLAITWLQPNGTFGNTTGVLNKTMVFDSGAAQPLRVV